MLRVAITLFLSLLLASCSRCPEAVTAASAPRPAANGPAAAAPASTPSAGVDPAMAPAHEAPPAAAPASPSGAAPSSPPAAPPSSPPGAASASPSGAPVDQPPAVAVPEVTVKSLGMHIGGGPNDDTSKAPYRAALEARFVDLQRCYAEVEQPGKDGSFGVDLRVPAEGGKPEVKQPRTALHGRRFRDCVLDVFRSVEFPKPKKGATMISYSVEFSAPAGRAAEVRAVAPIVDR